MAKMNRTLAKQDKQLAAVLKAEAEYKETKDADKLVLFFERMTKEGWTLQGVSWPFKLTDAYYRAGRYDDAWRELNELVLNPDTRDKARQWQIKVLKKEKKDYSHIQSLLDNNQ